MDQDTRLDNMAGSDELTALAEAEEYARRER